MFNFMWAVVYPVKRFVGEVDLKLTIHTFYGLSSRDVQPWQEIGKKGDK